jgi:hypothetical protein
VARSAASAPCWRKIIPASAGWALCDINGSLGEKLKRDCGADFFTTRFDELLA